MGMGGLYWVGTVLLTENLEVVDVFGPQTNADLTQTNAELLFGKPAPEFKLPFVSGGQRPDLYVFQDRILDGGKSTVLVFWATWNHASVDQLKILSDYLNQDRVLAQDPIFIAVNLQEDKKRVYDFLRNEILRFAQDNVNGQGRALEFLADETGEIGELYNVRTLPTTFFIDGQGIIQDIFVGVLNKEMLEEKINKLITH